jgi:hypothetical protein
VHPVFIHAAGAEDASTGARPAVDARRDVRLGNVVRARHEVHAAVPLEDLKLVTTAGAAAAHGVDLLRRHEDREMDEASPIGEAESLFRLGERHAAGEPLLDVPVCGLIQQEADLKRVVAAAVMRAAGARGEREGARAAEELDDLFLRDHPRLRLKDLADRNDPGGEADSSLPQPAIVVCQPLFQERVSPNSVPL